MHRITSNNIELHTGDNVIFEDAYNEKPNPRDVSEIEETVTKRSSSQENKLRPLRSCFILKSCKKRQCSKEKKKENGNI